MLPGPDPAEPAKARPRNLAAAPSNGGEENIRPRGTELTRDQAWELLGSVSYGRIVFSHDALPAIRPANHVLGDGHVIISTHRGAALLTPARDGAVVAYEADLLDPEQRVGWSVTVTGVATVVTDPEEERRYGQALQHWIGGPLEHVVRISPDLVSGYRIG